jgi:CheY-like chemotaxis protein
MGVSVVEVGSGEDAIAHLRSDSGAIDLLLTDFAMPGVNGMQTIARARALHPNVACAIMTGHIQETFADPVLSGVPILRKPVPTEDLAQLLGIGQELEPLADCR